MPVFQIKYPNLVVFNMTTTQTRLRECMDALVREIVSADGRMRWEEVEFVLHAAGHTISWLQEHLDRSFPDKHQEDWCLSVYPDRTLREVIWRQYGWDPVGADLSQPRNRSIYVLHGPYGRGAKWRVQCRRVDSGGLPQLGRRIQRAACDSKGIRLDADTVEKVYLPLSAILRGLSLWND